MEASHICLDPNITTASSELAFVIQFPNQSIYITETVLHKDKDKEKILYIVAWTVFKPTSFQYRCCSYS